MRDIALTELKAMVGQEIAVSDWVEISQERINLFAEATGDHQWIHIDVEKSRTASPYGSTVAHGYLTLSLLPMLLESAINVTGIRMGVNYGTNRVRFPAPVLAGSQVRGRIVLASIEPVEGGEQILWKVTMECRGSEKPVCVAEAVVRLYPV